MLFVTTLFQNLLLEYFQIGSSSIIFGYHLIQKCEVRIFADRRQHYLKIPLSVHLHIFFPKYHLRPTTYFLYHLITIRGSFRLSVRLSVTSRFSEMAWWIFLIFGINIRPGEFYMHVFSKFEKS